MKKIIFDVDGVLLSEQRFFDVSGLAVWEMLFGKNCLGLPTEGEDFDATRVTDGQIAAIRARAFGRETLFAWLVAHGMNSNWDMVHAHLVTTFALMADTYRERTGGEILSLSIETETDLKRVGALLTGLPIPKASEILSFWETKLSDVIGADILGKLSEVMAPIFGTVPVWSRPGSAFWRMHTEMFQAWYWGDDEFIRFHGRLPYCPGKIGFLKSEIPLAPKEAISALFRRLKTNGWDIAVATGRLRNETEIAFRALGWLSSFDPLFLATATDAEEAAKHLDIDFPGKPHPFLYECAVYGRRPERYAAYAAGTETVAEGSTVYVIGDSYADILGAKAIGAKPIGVLTGLLGERAAEMFAKEGVPCVKNVMDIERIFGEK